MPNIEGTIGPIDDDGSSGYTSGVFAAAGVTNWGSTGSEPRHIMSFNASRSSSIYGASDAVQPPALVLLPQIRY